MTYFSRLDQLIVYSTHGEGCYSQSQIKQWIQVFKSGGQKVNDNTWTGRPRTATNKNTINIVFNIIKTNWQVFIVDIYNYLDINYRSIHC